MAKHTGQVQIAMGQDNTIWRHCQSRNITKDERSQKMNMIALLAAMRVETARYTETHKGISVQHALSLCSNDDDE